MEIILQIFPYIFIIMIGYLIGIKHEKRNNIKNLIKRNNIIKAELKKAELKEIELGNKITQLKLDIIKKNEI